MYIKKYLKLVRHLSRWTVRTARYMRVLSLLLLFHSFLFLFFLSLARSLLFLQLSIIILSIKIKNDIIVFLSFLSFFLFSLLLYTRSDRRIFSVNVKRDGL